MASARNEDRQLQRCVQLAQGRGWRLALSLMGNAEDAEDLLQRALMIVSRKVDQAPRLNLWNWFAGILTMEARNQRRSRERRQSWESMQDTDPLWQDADAKDPAERLLERELRDQLWKSFQDLPDEEREALALVYLSGMSTRQAARSVGVSPTTIRTRVASGLAALRKQLDVPEKSITRALCLLPLPLTAPATLGALKAIESVSAGSSLTTGGNAPLIVGEVVMAKKISIPLIIVLFALVGIATTLLLVDGEDGTKNLSSDASSRTEGEAEQGDDAGNSNSANARRSASEPVKKSGVVGDNASGSSDVTKVSGDSHSGELDAADGASRSNSATLPKNYEPKSLPSEEDKDKDDEGWLTLTVLNREKEPVEMVRVTSASFDGSGIKAASHSDTTDANGQARLDPNTQTLELKAEGYASQGYFFAEGLIEDLTLTLKSAATVEVTVLDSNSAPLEGIALLWEYISLGEETNASLGDNFTFEELILSGKIQDLSRLEAFVSPTSFTSRSGAVNFDEVPANTRVRVRLARDLRDPKGASILRPEDMAIVELKAGEKRAVTLKISATQRMTGVLHTPDGDPCAGARISGSFHHVHETFTSMESSYSTTSDGEGRFTILGDFSKTSSLDAAWIDKTGIRYGAHHYQKATEDALIDIGVLTMESKINVKGVATVGGKPLEYSMVNLEFTLNGKLVTNTYNMTSEVGAFEITGINASPLGKPGFKAMLSARLISTPLEPIDVTTKVMAGEPLVADFSAPKMVKVHVKLVGAVVGQSATLYALKTDDAQFKGLPNPRTLEGSDNIVELAPGKYRVRVEQRNALSDWQDLEVASGSQPRLLFVMNAAARIVLNYSAEETSTTKLEAGESLHCQLVPPEHDKEILVGMLYLDSERRRADGWTVLTGHSYEIRITLGEKSWTIKTPFLADAKEHVIDVILPEADPKDG